jgi:hypothetical protein
MSASTPVSGAINNGPSTVLGFPSAAENVRALIGTYLVSRQRIVEAVRDLPRINAISGIVPSISAAYVVWDGDIVRYVGSSTNLKKRFYQHRRVHKDWPPTLEISWIPCEGFDLYGFEDILQVLLRPIDNKFPVMNFGDSEWRYSNTRTYACAICSALWIPKKENPSYCPRCLSRNWRAGRTEND